MLALLFTIEIPLCVEARVLGHVSFLEPWIASNLLDFYVILP